MTCSAGIGAFVMGDATILLAAVEQGDPKAADKLLELVYEDLRRLAAHKMAKEPAGQTLQPTALVHEACFAWWATKHPLLRIAPTFFLPPRKRCGEFWLNGRVAGRGSVTVENSNGLISMSVRWQLRKSMTSYWRSMRHWTNLPRSTQFRQKW